MFSLSAKQNLSALGMGVCLAVTSLIPQNVCAQTHKRGGNEVPAEVEIAYVKGLKFLSNVQSQDGSYGARYNSQPGLVGIITMAYLAHGEDAKSGPYAKNIQKGIDFILKSQNSENGYLGNSMYNHGFATLALAEAYGMVDDDRIGPALKKAVSLILSAQKRNPLGAWRYSPTDTSADSTVAGCQIVALLAARNAGIPVPDKSIDKALKYMETCRAANGGYGYTSPSGPRPTLTAIGSLCLSLAKKKDDKAFPIIIKNLEESPRSTMQYDFYHEYYVAQAFFHADEEKWKLWNEKNTKLMTSSQLGDGSWTNQRLGKPGATGFALLSMALNYRLLPIYEK